MKNKIYLKFFILLLKKHNAYESFLRNLSEGKEYRKFYGKEVDETKYIINKIKTDPRNLLVDAFNWGDDAFNWGDDDDDDIDWMTVSWEWDDCVSDLNRKLFKKN